MSPQTSSHILMKIKIFKCVHTNNTNKLEIRHSIFSSLSQIFYTCPFIFFLFLKCHWDTFFSSAIKTFGIHEWWIEYKGIWTRCEYSFSLSFIFYPIIYRLCHSWKTNQLREVLTSVMLWIYLKNSVITSFSCHGWLIFTFEWLLTRKIDMITVERPLSGPNRVKCHQVTKAEEFIRYKNIQTQFKQRRWIVLDDQ